ncbi:MAG: formyltransferase family protein [Planctomycetales bacterium]
MRIVVLMKALRWQPLTGDRFFQVLADGGVEVSAVVCQTVSLKTVAGRLREMSGSGRRQFFDRVLRRLRRTPQETPRENTPTLAAPRPAPATPIQRFHVKKHNSPECAAILRELQPDVVLLRGTDIIKPIVIESVPLVLNAHYGPLPTIRGMNSIQWSLLLGLPVTVTLHRVDANVDTGPILMHREMPVAGSDSIEQLNRQADRLVPELFRDGCLALMNNPPQWRPNPREQGRQYFRMHPFLLELAGRNLKKLRNT